MRQALMGGKLEISETSSVLETSSRIETPSDKHTLKFESSPLYLIFETPPTHVAIGNFDYFCAIHKKVLKFFLEMLFMTKINVGLH